MGPRMGMGSAAALIGGSSPSMEPGRGFEVGNQDRKEHTGEKKDLECWTRGRWAAGPEKASQDQRRCWGGWGLARSLAAKWGYVPKRAPDAGTKREGPATENARKESRGYLQRNPHKAGPEPGENQSREAKQAQEGTGGSA